MNALFSSLQVPSVPISVPFSLSILKYLLLLPDEGNSVMLRADSPVNDLKSDLSCFMRLQK